MPYLKDQENQQPKIFSLITSLISLLSFFLFSTRIKTDINF